MLHLNYKCNKPLRLSRLYKFSISDDLLRSTERLFAKLAPRIYKFRGHDKISATRMGQWQLQCVVLVHSLNVSWINLAAHNRSANFLQWLAHCTSIPPLEKNSATEQRASRFPNSHGSSHRPSTGVMSISGLYNIRIRTIIGAQLLQSCWKSNSQPLLMSDQTLLLQKLHHFSPASWKIDYVSSPRRHL